MEIGRALLYQELLAFHKIDIEIPVESDARLCP